MNKHTQNFFGWVALINFTLPLPLFLNTTTVHFDFSVFRWKNSARSLTVINFSFSRNYNSGLKITVETQGGLHKRQKN